MHLPQGPPARADCQGGQLPALPSYQHHRQPWPGAARPAHADREI